MAEHEPVLDHHDEHLLRRASGALARTAGSTRQPAEAALYRARVIARRRRTTRVALTALVVAAVVAAIVVPITVLGHPKAAPLAPAHQPHAVTPTTTVPSSAPTTTTPSTTVPPSTTTTTTAPAVPTGTWAVPPSGVVWATVAFPVNDGCGPGQKFPWGVTQETTMTPSSGPELAILLVQCHSTIGNWPGNLLVYDGATSPASPEYLTTLMAWPTQDYLASGFSVSGTTISIAVGGYSTTSVPRCCPNVHKTLQWTWANGNFRSG